MVTRPGRAAWRLNIMMGTTALVAVAGLSPAAFAQETGTGADPASIDRVVVTAEFRASTVEDTPLAITAVTGEMMEARSQTTIAQVGDHVPNVVLRPAGAAQGGSAMIAFIRGVGQNDFSYALEPGVGLYVDDVYYPTLSGALVELIDLDRVEILRGPQGTLAGKNSLGGAIKLYSVVPAGEDAGTISATYGTHDRIGVRGVGDFTLVEDKLYGRISGLVRSIDGYVDQYDYACTHPGSGLPSLVPAGGDCKLGTEGGQTLKALRASLRWEVSPDLDFTLTGDTTHEDSEARASVLVRAVGTGFPFSPSPVPVYADINGNNAFDPGVDVPHDCRFVTYGPNSCDTNPQGKYASYATYLDPTRTPALTPAQDPANPLRVPQVTDFDEWGVSLNGNWRLSQNFALQSITAYREYNSAFSEDTDGSPLAVQMEHQSLEHSQFSQEVRLNGTVADGAVDFTVGGFYFEQDGALEARVNLPYAALDMVVGPDETPSTTKALFGTATWHLTSRLNLTGGLRYSEDEKTYNFQRHNPDGSLVSGPCIAFPGFPLNPQNCGVFGVDGLSAGFKDDRFDYRVAADYRWTDNLMTYTQISTGYKGGGVNPRPFAPDQLNNFGAEELLAYEAGFKSAWFNRRVQLNAAVFFNDYSDIQLNFTRCPTSVLPSPCLQPRNAGDAEVLGFEAEGEWFVTDALRVDGSVGVLDFDYTRIDPNTAALPGFVPPYTPELTWSVGAQYEFALAGGSTLTPRIDATYRDAVYSEALNAPTNLIEDYTLVNARLSWVSPDADWKVALEVTNLFDEYYFLTLLDVSNTAGFTSGHPGAPRMAAMTVTREF
jgi:iron complex outermembrane receptor protein